MTDAPELNVVTGAFSYTGKYIARRLLAQGKKVRTLTRHPPRPNPFGPAISVAPFDFGRSDELTDNLRGATALYNTYWVRFPSGQVTYETAVANTRTLLRAAVEAGVRRFVHLSVTNASAESPLSYFRGKGLLEETIRESNLSYAILRPTMIFGLEDILLNNIAWLLRRFPVFAIPGSGDYRLQPVFVGDVADLAVSAAEQEENIVLDAVGPETYTFEELVRLLAEKIRSRARIIHLKPGLALFLSRLVGAAVRDVVLTEEELEGLMANLLVSANPATGRTRLSDWLEENRDRVGTRYASELQRHYP